MTDDTLAYRLSHCGGARHGIGGLAPKMSLSPNRETHWSRIRRWSVRFFQFV